MALKNMTVPDIGGATDVDIIEVLVNIGDYVKIDSPLLTLESDKATLEVPSTEEGTIKEIKVKVGQKVSQGSVIVVLETASTSSEKTPVTPVASSPVLPKTISSAVLPTPPSEPVVSLEESPKEEIHGSPLVRKLAREFGIDLKVIKPTGPKDRILKEDLQNYVKARLSQNSTGSGMGLPSAPTVDFSKWGEVESKPLSRIQKLSGKNLHRNWLLVPHVTQFNEADITELEKFRTEQKAALEKQGIKLTPLVFIMKAVTSALKAFPRFNASLDNSTGENIIFKNYYHIGVAVDTPDGLVVPVIRDVDKKGLTELAKELSEISEKARKGQLTGQDMQGGCFTISSLGGIGGTAFTPIINVPEVAILGVSKSSLKPVYQHGQFMPRLMLPLSLSYDHRVIDGAEGARFAVYLASMLSDTRNLLL